MSRAGWRSLRFGLSTVLGVRRSGFFIPYRFAGQITEPADYPEVVRAFEDGLPSMAELIGAASALMPALRAIAPDAPAPSPRWNQDWFPRLDAAVAYTLARARGFRRIVEIGAGHSTRFLTRAAADGGHDARHICIDPHPRAEVAGLPVMWFGDTVEKVGLEPFQDLTEDDAVFIDSSHILMPGTDVDFLFGTVLPRLPRGIHVHVHDIFLPWGYPADWAWRGYNEQSALAPLLALGGFQVVWSSAFARARLAEDIKDAGLDDLPLVEGARETSLWLVKG